MEEQRREFVRATIDCSNFSALCREFGVDRHTGYKWLKRYLTDQPLTNRSRCPHTSPSRTPEDVEQLILTVRTENPGWGAKTIHSVLEQQGYPNLPCVKTVNNILKRHGCISPEESLKHRAYIRFEKEQCNMMWQTDFKGEFLMLDGHYCFPLNILDDHSRFALKIAPRLSTKNVVISVFEEAFKEYGLPDSILSDNGAQFAGFKRGYTQFERRLMDLDILPIHGRIKHPQTQGKIERFHRTMKQELLKHTEIADIEDAKRKLSAWRDKYNNIRPHEALGMKTPGKVYVPSQREYKEQIKKWEYGGQYHVIKANCWGYVRFSGWQVFLSETMKNQYLEFRPSPDGGSFIVCYRNFKIAEFSTEDGSLLNRSISRL